jgi:GNAT superfamily N-acetyltransferase
MAEPKPDDMLREAAKARGFRLVKSRRRKPGGDFGRYGLVDLKSGRECLGFGREGLTATAAQVHDYLRGGEVASWKRSLIGVVGDDAQAPAKPKGQGKPVGEGPVGEGDAKPAPPQGSRGPRAPKPETKTAVSPAKAGPRNIRSEAKAGKPAPVTGKPDPGPRRGPTVAIRDATRRDAAALARLLDLDASTLAERLAAAIQADEPALLAERDAPVGIAAWTVLPTLQHGPRGRVTLLFVAQSERRQGTGTRLLEEVERRLAAAGVAGIEMTLDIQFDAPTGFLRRTGWSRTANGYGKILSPPGPKLPHH